MTTDIPTITVEEIDSSNWQVLIIFPTKTTVIGHIVEIEYSQVYKWKSNLTGMAGKEKSKGDAYNELLNDFQEILTQEYVEKNLI